MVGDMYRDTTQGRDPNINATNFGGLNTQASPLNMPWADSPELINMDVTVGGKLTKRKGTRNLGQAHLTDDEGINLVSVMTALGIPPTSS